jgi:hypothetical protein
MEGALFAKLCRECCLVDGGGLAPPQVDLVFAQVADKVRGRRTVSYGVASVHGGLVGGRWCSRCIVEVGCHPAHHPLPKNIHHKPP